MNFYKIIWKKINELKQRERTLKTTPEQKRQRKTTNGKKITSLGPVLKGLPFSTGSLLNLKTIMAKINIPQHTKQILLSAACLT